MSQFQGYCVINVGQVAQSAKNVPLKLVDYFTFEN